MPREYTTRLAKELRHTRNWIRLDDGGDDYLKSLCQSYLARPLYPLISALDLELYDGNLRLESVLRFAPKGGDTELPVCLTDEPHTPSLSLEVQMESAAFTKGLTDYEQFIGCSEWLRLNSSSTAKELAGRIRRDEAVLSKILSLSKGIPAVKDAAKDGLLTYAKWWPICKLPPEEQPALLAASLNGATCDELHRRSRKNGSVDRTTQNPQPPVRMPRIKIPLATEAATGTVTLAGENIDLDDAETLLKEAMKAVRAAKDKNLDTKTAQSVWRDMAKAGS